MQPVTPVRFSRQESWSGWPSPAPGDLPNPGVKPASLASPGLAGESLPLAPPGKSFNICLLCIYVHICVCMYMSHLAVQQILT